MNANVIYEVYEITRKNRANDLTVGLALYNEANPETPISHDESKAIRKLISRHGETLANAYQSGDKEAFLQIAAGLIAKESAEAQG